MKLVIVGSVERDWLDSEMQTVQTAIHDVITRYQTADFTIGSGESPGGGVDIWVREEAAWLGIPFREFPPTGWGWEAYKVRNQQMADWCTALVRIKSIRSITYGSGWTRDRAKEQGKPTEEIIIG